MDNQDHNCMSKAEAVGILCSLAMRPELSRDEVIAIQTACRSTVKRLFDRERNRKRRNEARANGTSAKPVETPPASFTPETEAFAELNAMIADRSARHESLRNSSIFAHIEIGDNGGNVTRNGYLFAIDDETRESKRSADGDLAALVQMLREGFEDTRTKDEGEAKDEGEGVYKTPPAALDVIAGDRPLDALLQNPPFDAATPAEENEEDAE